MFNIFSQQVSDNCIFSFVRCYLFTFYIFNFWFLLVKTLKSCHIFVATLLQIYTLKNFADSPVMITQSHIAHSRETQVLVIVRAASSHCFCITFFLPFVNSNCFVQLFILSTDCILSMIWVGSITDFSPAFSFVT